MIYNFRYGFLRMPAIGRILWVSVFIVICLGICSSGCNPRIQSDVPLLTTPDWNSEGLLSMRYDSAGGNVLLLMHLAPDVSESHGMVYQYDILNGAFSKASRQQWEAASDEVCDCSIQSGPGRYIGISRHNNKLQYDNQLIATKGETAISLRWLRNSEYVAVISADGRPSGGLMPFVGGRVWSSRQHYHQIFRIRPTEPIGFPVRLPMTTSAENDIRGCWTSDLRFVIYTDERFTKLCIVPAQLPHENQK